jgi:hypothetical protein
MILHQKPFFNINLKIPEKCLILMESVWSKCLEAEFCKKQKIAKRDALF